MPAQRAFGIPFPPWPTAPSTLHYDRWFLFLVLQLAARWMNLSTGQLQPNFNAIRSSIAHSTFLPSSLTSILAGWPLLDRSIQSKMPTGPTRSVGCYDAKDTIKHRKSRHAALVVEPKPLVGTSMSIALAGRSLPHTLIEGICLLDCYCPLPSLSHTLGILFLGASLPCQLKHYYCVLPKVKVFSSLGSFFHFLRVISPPMSSHYHHASL